MDNKSISNWIRQARYRAKSIGVPSDIEIPDILSILEYYENKCAFTGKPADTLDHVFPLRERMPNVPANVLPVCKAIKNLKKNNNITWLHSEGHITKEQYTTIIRDMLKRRGDELVREGLRKLTGQ